MSLATFKIKQHERVLFLVGFLLIYFVIDYLNMPYSQMIEQYSWTLVVFNVVLNVVMASLSTYLMHLNALMIHQKGVELKGSNFSIFSVLFGLLTYGCTPCVIALFANIGITFSVIALPLAGLPYKGLSLLLIGLGIVISHKELKKAGCAI